MQNRNKTIIKVKKGRSVILLPFFIISLYWAGDILDKDVNVVLEPYKSVFFKVAVVECVLAAILVLTVMSVKFFAPKTYSQAKKWYVENVQIDTDSVRTAR